MDRYRTTRPLCEIGRAPGTAPAATKERTGSRDAHYARWEADVPAALANLAFTRVLAENALLTAVVLRVLQHSSLKAIPPLGKREWLQARRLIVALGDGLWDVHELGRAEIARVSAVPSLSEEDIRKILDRAQR